MQNLNFARLLALSVFAVGASFFAIGCDQVKDMANDVQKKVMDEEPDTTEPAVVDETSAPPTPDPTPATPLPTPEELFAEFDKLKPHEISDGALNRITSQPAAAAMVNNLEVASQDITAGGIKAMALMKNLASLKLSGSRLKPDDLKQLATVSSLKQLNLAASQTDDSTLQSLSGLAQLESLDISGTKITSAAGAGLSQMKHLQEINLSGTPTDDTIIAALSALPLRKIILAKTRITNVSLPILFEFPDLEYLSVPFTSVTGAGFQGCGKTSIKYLNVGETNFGIDGFMAIKGMKALEELNVYSAGLVEHKNANVFKTFPKLKVLYAGRNSITDAGMKVFFQGHRSLESLNVSHNKKISDQGLAALVGVKTLKLLNATGTSVGAQGAQALKQRLPDCKIVTSSGEY